MVLLAICYILLCKVPGAHFFLNKGFLSHFTFFFEFVYFLPQDAIDLRSAHSSRKRLVTLFKLSILLLHLEKRRGFAFVILEHAFEILLSREVLFRLNFDLLN